MKNFYLAVVIAIMFPLSIFARPVDLHNVEQSQSKNSIDISTYTITENDIIDYKVGDYPAPQMAFNVFIPNAEYFWTTIFDGVTPFVYEPNSGTLIYVTTLRELVNEVTVSHIVLYFSKDNGRTWTSERVYTLENGILFFPSIAVLNPNNETDPVAFKYVISTTPYLPETEPGGGIVFRGKGSMFFYFYGKLDGVASWENMEFQVENFPVSNNPGGGQLWGLSNKRMLSVSSPKGDHFYIYGTLTPETGYQYGAYGLAFINFTETAEPESQLPEAWGFSNFRPSTDLDRSFNAPFRMAADPEGNVYAFFYNIYPEDENLRLPSFSKSTDNGRTWSSLTKMPVSIINDYLANFNHNPNWRFTEYAFTSWDVVVTGVDEFSIFQKLFTAEGSTEETAVIQTHIVEMPYKNSWQQIRKVGDYWPAEPPLLIRFNTENAPNYIDEIIENYRYHELEAAPTADGQGIVVKWLSPKLEDNTAKLVNPQQLYNNFMVTIDEMYTTDIFVATRSLSSNQWNQYNTTQDKWYNKGTYLPRIVPSFNAIPVAEFITQRISETANYRFVYPYFLQNIVGDRRFADQNGETRILYSVAISAFDASNPSPVNNPSLQRPDGIQGVSVSEAMPFSMDEIAPNPANDISYINFVLDNTSDVRIAIHNSMGQTLKTVNLNSVQEGANTVTVTTNDLPAGAYFYTITVNGKSQTKLLNVIR